MITDSSIKDSPRDIAKCEENIKNILDRAVKLYKRL